MIAKSMLSMAMAISLFAYPSSLYAQHTKLIAATEGWCPYVCNPHADNPGFLVEVMTEIYTAHAIKIEYRIVPWRRAILNTEKGISDAAIGAVEGNHGHTILGQENLGVDETVFVVRKHDTFVYRNPESLNDKILGAIDDYTYDNNGELDHYLNDRKQKSQNIHIVHQKNPIASLFKMLLSNRIDTFPENRNVANYYAEMNMIKDHIRIIPSGAVDNIHIAFSPSEKGRFFRSILDNGINKMRKSGKLEELKTKYRL